MPQKERDEIMNEFRGGKRCFLLSSHAHQCSAARTNCVVFSVMCSRVLIATDVWGRGLDVQQVSLVRHHPLRSVSREELTVWFASLLRSSTMTCPTAVSCTSTASVVRVRILCVCLRQFAYLALRLLSACRFALPSSGPLVLPLRRD